MKHTLLAAACAMALAACTSAGAQVPDTTTGTTEVPPAFELSIDGNREYIEALEAELYAARLQLVRTVAEFRTGHVHDWGDVVNDTTDLPLLFGSYNRALTELEVDHGARITALANNQEAQDAVLEGRIRALEHGAAIATLPLSVEPQTRYHENEQAREYRFVLGYALAHDLTVTFPTLEGIRFDPPSFMWQAGNTATRTVRVIVSGLGLDDVYVLPTVAYDGGTGHGLGFHIHAVPRP